MTEIEKEYYRRLALQEEYGGTNKPVNKITPLVSVVTITYQHAPYIRQCLDGILMQETDFPYEIIIGEDGSTDGTREICIEYANKYPDKIRLFLRDRKLTQYVTKDGRTIRFNGHFARAAARGKYVAMCEGDDYWIDEKKLEKQVEVLRNHRYSLCCTNYFVLNNGKMRATMDKKKEYTVRDIIKLNRIATLTVMFRKDLLPPFDPELAHLWFGDWILWIKICQKGNIYKLEDCTSVYRVHSSSASNSVSTRVKYGDVILMYKVLGNKYVADYKEAVATGQSLAYCNFAINLAYDGATKEAAYYLAMSLHKKVSSETLITQLKTILLIANRRFYIFMKKQSLLQQFITDIDSSFKSGGDS